jgi:hypothetical protein
VSSRALLSPLSAVACGKRRGQASCLDLGFLECVGHRLIEEACSSSLRMRAKSLASPVAICFTSKSRSLFLERGMAPGRTRRQQQRALWFVGSFDGVASLLAPSGRRGVGVVKREPLAQLEFVATHGVGVWDRCGPILAVLKGVASARFPVRSCEANVGLRRRRLATAGLARRVPCWPTGATGLKLWGSRLLDGQPPPKLALILRLL